MKVSSSIARAARVSGSWQDNALLEVSARAGQLKTTLKIIDVSQHPRTKLHPRSPAARSARNGDRRQAFALTIRLATILVPTQPDRQHADCLLKALLVSSIPLTHYRALMPQPDF